MVVVSRNIALSILFVFIHTGLIAQLLDDDPGKGFYNKYGFRFYTGNVFAHTRDVRNTLGTSPFAFEIELSKRIVNQEVWDLCRCYPTTGYLIAFKNYNNEILGYGFNTAYFVQYHFLSAAKISPVIRGAGGIEYNTNPYNAKSNTENHSYSSPVNASLQLAIGMDAHLGKNLVFDILFGFNHISNGGLRQPNRGINWYGTAFNVSYVPNFLPPQKISTSHSGVEPGRKWMGRFEIYLSYLSETFDEKERLVIYGSEATLGRRVSGLNTVLAGIEWNLDMRNKRRVEYYDLNVNPNRFSFLSGHEFNMGAFRFSQKIGIYFFDQLKHHDLLYHKWGINFNFSRNLIVGIDVKAHRHVAEFIGFRFGVYH